MTSPEIKYTDRDLRENVSLHDMAEEYVRNYEGEFQFLVDAKMALARDGGIPTPVARGVVNCMRVDPRVAGTLPTPLPPVPGTVTNIRRARTKTRKPWNDDMDCDDTLNGVEHNGHGHEDDDETGWCKGYHRINREYYTATPARVKRPFIAARGGKFIHAVNPDGEHEVQWPHPPHEWGFHDRNPVLSVKLMCKYPSWITGGILYTPERAGQVALLTGREPCPHCNLELGRDHDGR